MFTGQCSDQCGKDIKLRLNYNRRKTLIKHLAHLETCKEKRTI